MKKSSTIVLFTTLAVGALAFAGTGMARHRMAEDAGCGAHGGPGIMKESGRGGIGRLERFLDLSESQRSAIHGIRQASRSRMHELRDALSDQRFALREMVRNGKYDEQKAGELARAQGEHLAEMLLLRTRNRAAIRDLLTEQQREQLASRPDRHADSD